MKVFRFVRGGVALLLAMTGCATRSEESQQPTTAVLSRITTARALQGDSALREFTPAREGILVGGECLERKLPADTVSRYSVYFPTRRNPDVLITLIATASGIPVRYSEMRGVPKPTRSPDGAILPDSGASTHFQLDYVTGEAIVGNRLRGQADEMVMTSVEVVESSGLLGSIYARIETVRRVCKAAR